jgi:hypothetical protein
MRRTVITTLLCAFLLPHITAQQTQRYMDPLDPNLNPNWDWTVPVLGQGHPMWFSPTGGAPTQVFAQVPFFTNGHPLKNGITNAEIDMYKIDGWMLVYKDFGTPALGAPKLPFFVLYNKYKGVLRVMVYNGSGFSYSAYTMKLTFKSSSPKSALLSFASDARPYVLDYDANESKYFVGSNTPLQDWFYGDFLLFNYIPSLNANTMIGIELEGNDISSLSVSSTEFTLSEVLKDGSPAGASSSGGSNVKDIVNKGEKFFSGVDKVNKTLKDMQLPYISGTLGSAIPLIGPVLGIVSLFIGGKDKPAPREPLNLRGSLQLQGQLVLSRTIWSEDFALFSSNTLFGIYRPVQPIPWGVFSAEKPLIHKYVEIFHYCCGFLGCYPEDQTDKMKYFFNNLGGTMTLVSARARYHSDDPNRTPYTAWVNIPTTVISGETYFDVAPLLGLGDCYGGPYLGLELSLKINVTLQNQDDDIVVFKLYKTDYALNYLVYGKKGNHQDSVKEKQIPLDYKLKAQPNPFTSTTSINFSLSQDENTAIKIYSISGSLIKVLEENKFRPKGVYSTLWDGNDIKGSRVSPGVYVCTIITKNGIQSVKIVRAD